MDPGEFERRITIERAISTRDEMNEEVPAWEPLTTVWAAYEPIRDGERYRADERAAEISARFRIYWSSQVADVSAKDRLTFEGQTFELLNVKEIGRREILELTAAGRGDG